MHRKNSDNAITTAGTTAFFSSAVGAVGTLTLAGKDAPMPLLLSLAAVSILGLSSMIISRGRCDILGYKKGAALGLLATACAMTTGNTISKNLETPSRDIEIIKPKNYTFS